jgi:acyl-CoA synthetase (NDP forming)
MFDLSALMRPKTVAVVGANDDCGSFGGRIWHYLGKYSDLNRMAVNVRADALNDVRVVPRLSELPEVPDIVVLATPGRTVEALVAESVSVGARATLVFSQVPPETLPELGRIVDDGGMALLGPGSLGLINANDGVVLSSSVSLERAPQPGRLALVAQSGALMGVLHACAAEQGLGLGLCVATGSQLRVRVEHLLASLSTEGEYLAVGAHLEDVDVGLFVSAAESLSRAGRKLIVLKGGLTAPGSLAAAGHSGALASDGRAFQALARELGIVVATHPAELLACMQAATVKGKSWCFATVSGGLAAIAGDIASESAFGLVPPNPEIKVFPPGNERFEHTNPVDIDGIPMTTEESVAAVQALAMDRTYDGVVLVLNDKPGLEDFLSKLARVDEEARSRLHLCSECSGQYDDAWSAWVAEGGNFSRGLSCFVHALASTRETSCQPAGGLGVEGQLMSAVDAHDLLARAGVPTLPVVEVQDIEALELTISALKLPLVLKLADVEHRSSEGVAIVTSRSEARASFERLARTGAVIAQPLAQPGLEFYVGVNIDRVFGPLFLVGAGGRGLEAEQDISMTIGLPDRAGIERCIGQTRVGRWLTSSLGSPLVDLDLLVDVALRATALAQAMKDSLVALDLNPVVIGPSGAMVIDAKVHVTKAAISNGAGAL